MASVQEASGAFGAWLNGAFNGIDFNEALNGVSSRLSSAIPTEGILRPRRDSDALTLDDWVGAWEMEAKDRHDAFLDSIGEMMPLTDAFRVPVGQDAPGFEFEENVVEGTGLTMEHHAAAMLFYSGRSGSRHLRFCMDRGDMDNSQDDLPSPSQGTATSSVAEDSSGTGESSAVEDKKSPPTWRSFWAGEADPAQGAAGVAEESEPKPVWRNYWEEDPCCFTSELPNFMGRQGFCVTIMRHLTSKSKILITMKAFDKGELKVRSTTTVRKVCSPVENLSPEPLPEALKVRVSQEPAPKKLSRKPADMATAEVWAEAAEECNSGSSGSSTDLPPSARRHSAENPSSPSSAFSDVSSESLPTSNDKVSMTPDPKTPAAARHNRMSMASTCAGSSRVSTGCQSRARRQSCASCLSMTDEIDECASMSEAPPAPFGGKSMLTTFPVALNIRAWDWPLSRYEKKALTLMCDRQHLILQRVEVARERDQFAAQRDELVAQLCELRLAQC